MRIRGLFFFLFLSVTFVNAQESALDSSEKKLEWRAVENAHHYLVEIERDGVILHTLKTENNFIPLFLNPGEYRLRISAYNKFDKLASQSDWSPLTVYPSVQPVVEKISPEVTVLDGEQLHLRIEGTDFHENSRFVLFYRDSKIEGTVLEQNRVDDKDNCLVSFFKTDLIPAEWDLEIINPSGKSYIKKEALRVERNSLPEINSISSRKFYKNQNNGTLTIEGERFSPTVTILIDGEKSHVTTEGEVFFEREIVFLLNVDDLETGEHKLSIMNDTGLISNEIIIMIENPPLTGKDRAIKVREKSNFSLGLSYHLSFPMDEGDLLFDISPAGLGVMIRSKFNNPSVYKIPVLRNIGFFTDLDFTYLSLKKQGFYEDLILTANVGLYYLSVYDFPFNFIISIGAGPAYSFFLFEDSKVLRSFDFSNKLTLALLYEKNSRIMEAGFSTTSIQYQYNSLTMIKPYFLYGWEF
jgi:hypothetical protein